MYGMDIKLFVSFIYFRLGTTYFHNFLNDPKNTKRSLIFLVSTNRKLRVFYEYFKTVNKRGQIESKK